MNALYLILIALGFSAGVLATALKTDKESNCNLCVEEKEESSAADQIILEQDTKPETLYFFIE